MKLFLFSACVFYILGLKIISKVEIPTLFQQSSATTEISNVPSEKINNATKSRAIVQDKKDSLAVVEDKTVQLAKKPLKK